MKYELIANAIVIGGWALGLALLTGSFLAWYFGWDVRAKRLARRLRARVGKPAFVRSASWWVDGHGVRRPARHRARGLVRAAVRRRVRRVVLAVAVFVDELTAPARMVVAA